MIDTRGFGDNRMEISDLEIGIKIREYLLKLKQKKDYIDGILLFDSL